MMHTTFSHQRIMLGQVEGMRGDMLTVSFWNGAVFAVPRGNLLWISDEHYEISVHTLKTIHGVE